MHAEVIFSTSTVLDEVGYQSRDPARSQNSQLFKKTTADSVVPSQHKNETHLVFVAWVRRSQAVWRVRMSDRRTHAHIPTCLIDSSLCSHLCARLTTSSTPAPASSIHQPLHLLMLAAATTHSPPPLLFCNILISTN